MKNIAIILLSAIAVIGISCTDDFIEVPVRTTLELEDIVGAEGNSTTGRDELNALMVAAYQPMSWQHEFNGNGAWYFRWYIGDVCSDDAFKGGENDADGPFVREMEEFRTTAGNLVVFNHWTKNYRGIFRSNTLIETALGAPLSDEEVAEFVAQGKFLRAVYHFDLTRLFGNIVYADSSTLLDFQQSNREQAYAKVIEDLEEAIPALPLKSQLRPEELGQGTKGAARAFIAKAYLEMGDYASAKPFLQAIINSGEYSLVSDYASIWLNDGEHGAGSIFEINYVDSPIISWNGGGDLSGADFNPGSVTPQMTRARGAANGWGFNCPTRDLIDEYEDGDPRMRQSIFFEGDDFGDWGRFVEGAELFENYSRKYFNTQAEFSAASQGELAGENNERVIRYADVLLMFAEAAAQTADEGAARNALNEVRARARQGNNGVLPAVTASGDALIQAIRHERRVELAMEGHRYYDLLRWGANDAGDNFQSVIAAMKTKRADIEFNPEVHKFLPIPQQEIDQSGGALNQNFGY